MRLSRLAALFAAFGYLTVAGAASARPTVVELFTSQGCVACPPADALLKELASQPDIIALSFHVHYWDSKHWQDPFASEDNTDRQKDYVAALGLDTLFTPQVIVDGSLSAVGSDRDAVAEAITDARYKAGTETPVSIVRDASGDSLTITIGDGTPASLPPHADIYEVHFNRGAATEVSGGENDGQTLPSTNNVVEIIPLVSAPGYRLPLSRLTEDGVAILVQGASQGKVLGAAAYMKP